MTPVEVVRLWFEAHASGDLDQARELVVAGLEVTVPGASLRGFDAFMQWYRERQAAEGPSFGYAVEDLLSGERHAAAVLTLHNGQESWRQVALYEVAEDRIVSIWLAEDR
jgi:hypothetical protein